jgi:hypothetical protein
MSLIVEPRIGKKNEILDNVSIYKPSEKEKARLADIRRDYETADIVRNNTYKEFGDRTLIQFQNECQQAFNTYIPPRSENPDEKWKAQTRKPIIRNKIISIAAHVTSTILYPDVIAQNDNDSEDADAAQVMRDLMEYSWEKSDYARHFVLSVIAGLVNPAIIIHEDYAEIKRKIKEIKKDGSWKEKEAIDEVFSGFKNILIPVDELYIGNAYTYNIQEQPFLIWRRIIDYSNAKIKYGNNENFKKYVRPGLRIYYDEKGDNFYEQYDDELEDRLVEEIIYYNRFADLELAVVNGVLLDDPDKPMRRMDKMYPFAKSGYEPFDEGRFFYMKPAADKMLPDEKIVNKLYDIIIDGSFMKAFPPIINTGPQIITSNVMIPGSSTSFEDPTQKVEPLQITGDFNAGMNTLQLVENSINESSQDPLQSGQQSKGSSTAFEIGRLEANAKTVLGLFGKMLVNLIEDFGRLRLNTILQNMTIGEAVETLGDITTVKFNSVLVSDRDVDGKKMSRRIDFDMDIPEKEEDKLKESFKIMEEEEKKNMRIAKVNPILFRKLKYKVKINPDFISSSSEAVKKALNLEAYDRLIQNPLISQDPQKMAMITRDFLLANYKPGEEDKYIDVDQPIPQQNEEPEKPGNEVISQILNKGQQPLTKAAI